jgi:hypothetical protein
MLYSMLHTNMGDIRVVFAILVAFGMVVHTKKIRYDYGDGSFYKGSVDRNGKPSGQGEYYNSGGNLTYVGNFHNGAWHGPGTWYGRHGDRYEGDFVHGQGSGKGTWYRANREMIIGEFKNHTLNGEATWYHNKRKMFEGNFRRGYAHGHAVMELSNGRTYDGMFKKGYAHGHGKMVEKDGKVVFEGKFENGIPKDDAGYDVMSDVINDFPMRLTY